MILPSRVQLQEKDDNVQKKTLNLRNLTSHNNQSESG